MSRKTWRTSAAEADRSHKTFCKALTGELATAKKIIKEKKAVTIPADLYEGMTSLVHMIVILGSGIKISPEIEKFAMALREKIGGVR